MFGGKTRDRGIGLDGAATLHELTDALIEGRFQTIGDIC